MGEVTIECMGPADVTKSLRLRSYYLVKYGIKGVRKYQERLEEVLVARVPKTEQGKHSEKIMKIRKGKSQRELVRTGDSTYQSS